MISYFDELELKGEKRGEKRGLVKGRIEGMIQDKIESLKIESLCSFVQREFDQCPPELREKCVEVNDFPILDQIWNFALFKAQSLDELMAFVDERMTAQR